MTDAAVDLFTDGGLILMRVTVPSGAACELELTADDAREFSNRLGGAIQHITRSDMTDQLAGWTPDPEPANVVPETENPPAATGFGGWLPASVQRAQYLEEIQENREARAAERARADQAEQAHDRAVSAYVAASAARGEHVGAMDIASGNLGRDLADVLAGAAAQMDTAPDRADERFYAEPVIQGARRSSWPASEFELDRMVTRAQQLHDDLVGWRVKRDYGTAEAAAREKSEARHGRGPMIGWR